MTGRPRVSRERATWEIGDLADVERGGICSDTEFDERAFLAGKWKGQHLAADKEYSTDTESTTHWLCRYVMPSYRIGLRLFYI